MPANYSRTTSRRFQLGLEDKISTIEKKIQRMLSVTKNTHKIICKNGTDAVLTANTLNQKLEDTKITEGYYLAINNLVYYCFRPNQDEQQYIGDLPLENYTLSTGDFSRRRARDDDPLLDRDYVGENRFEDTDEQPRTRSKLHIDMKFFESTSERYDNEDAVRASLYRLDPRTLAPHSDSFMRDLHDDYDSREAAEEGFEQFAHQHTMMMRTSKLTGRTLNIESHLSSSREVVHAAPFFASDMVLETFERTKDFGFDERALGEIRLFDYEEIERNYAQKQDSRSRPVFIDRETREIVERLKQGKNEIGYIPPNPEDPQSKGVLYMNARTMNPQDFVNGVYFHELQHMKLRMDYATDFERFERDFDVRTSDNVAAQTLNWFEEAAADVHTYQYMQQSQEFSQRFFEKYNLQRINADSVEKFFQNAKNDVDIYPSNYIASVLVATKHISPRKYGLLVKHLTALGEEPIMRAFDIAKSYEQGIQQEGISLEPLRELLTRGDPPWTQKE